MNSMETAPRDRRILILVGTQHYDRNKRLYVESGEKWCDCWWVKPTLGKPRWEFWCGNEKTHSTAVPNIRKGWVELPENRS